MQRHRDRPAPRQRATLHLCVLAGLLVLAPEARANELGGAAPCPAEPPAPTEGAPCPAVLPRPGVNPLLVVPPARRVRGVADGGSRNFLIPALEIPVINFVHWGILKGMGKPYAQISLDTMWENISGWHWIVDNDNFLANGFGHPYQGSFAYMAARSSGIGAVGSFPYAFVSSAFWELLMEKEDPSINDMIMTPIGGSVLGEVLYRSSLLVLDDGDPSFVRWLASSLLSPITAVNMLLFGRRANEFFPHPPYFASVQLGAGASIRAYTETSGTRVGDAAMQQFVTRLELIYGLPGDDRLQLHKPFDHFVASAGAAASVDPNVTIFLRGIAAGLPFKNDALRGLAGIYLGYDYTNLGKLRVATVSVGVGTAAQIQLTQKTAVLPTVVLSAVPFGAGGDLEPPIDQRDYHHGPGAQGLVSLQLVRAGLGRLGVDARVYFVTGAFRDEGWQAVRYTNVYGEIAITKHLAFGLELADNARNGRQETPALVVEQRLTFVNAYFTFLTDDSFGAFTRAPCACSSTP